MDATAPRKVLIVTYDFPPGLAGVRRIVKFARYLPEFGWSPVVLTTHPDRRLPLDYDTMAEVEQGGYPVIRTISIDPVQFASWLAERRTGAATSPAGTARTHAPPGTFLRALHTAAQWFLIPDDRIGWKPFAVRAGIRLLREHNIRAIITTSYPHSTHLIGRALRRKTRLPWLADFRDGWTQNPYFASAPTPFHRARARTLEASVAREAQALTAVSEPISAHLRTLAPTGRVTTIANGFDPADLHAIEPDRAGRRTLAYTGTLFGQRTPEVFFRALAELLARRPELRERIVVRFRTRFQSAHTDAIHRYNLSDVIDNLGFGSHRDALRLQAGADALLVLEGDAPHAEIMLTQKIFEYLAAGKPVLAAAPPGALADLVQSTGAGLVVPPTDANALTDAIARFADGTLPGPAPAAAIASYHRRNLTRQLAQVLDRIAS